MTKISRRLAGFLALFLVAGCQATTRDAQGMRGTETQPEISGQSVDDAAITASVKSRLVGDKTTNLFRVDVDASRGIVYLSGTVDSPEQKARAARLARRVNGVKKVINNIQVAQR